jgi:hypothetical protein
MLAALWLPANGSTPGVSLGWVMQSSAANVTHPALSAADFRAQLRRTRWTSGRSAGAVGGVFTAHTVCWRGNASALGGFSLRARFGLPVIVASSRAFIGVAARVDGAVASESFDSAGNREIFGIGFSGVGASWGIVRRGTGATHLFDELPLAPRRPGDVYDLVVTTPPGGGAFWARVVNLATNTVVCDDKPYDGDIPDSASMLAVHAHCGVSRAGNPAQLELASLSLERF